MLDGNQIDLEAQILGGILNDNSLLEVAKDKINKNTFQYKDNQLIYSLLQKSIEEHTVVDLVNFIEINKEYITACGGVTYITDIDKGFITNANFKEKIQLLLDNKNKAVIRETCKDVSENIIDLKEMENRLEDALKEIKKNKINREINIEDDYENFLNWLYSEDEEQGIPTGLDSLDNLLGNLQGGRLVTIFARSNVGKSTLAIDVAGKIALIGHHVIYGSGEMSLKEVSCKIAASRLSINLRKVFAKALTIDQKKRIAALEAELLNNKFMVTTKTNFEEFMKEVETYRIQFGLDVLFVDYVNKYIDGVPGNSMTTQIGYVTSRLKAYALEKNICVVMLAQANRKADGEGNTRELYEKLTVSDIQDSARIEQDSDQIIALYRNILFDNELAKQQLEREGKIDTTSPNGSKNPNVMNATVLKNRHGEKGTTALRWIGQYSSIKNFK